MKFTIGDRVRVNGNYSGGLFLIGKEGVVLDVLDESRGRRWYPVLVQLESESLWSRFAFSELDKVDG